MAEAPQTTSFMGPLGYVDKLAKVHRILKSAQFRTDQRLALRELCEAMLELTAALTEKEQGTVTPPATP